MTDATDPALAVRRQAWRAAALAAGTRLFARRGFHQTGMGDVASEAQVSLRALYTVFGSKDELHAAVLDEAFGRLLPVLEAPRDVPALIADLFDFMADNREVCLLYARATGREPFAAYTEAVEERLATIIGTAEPRVRAEVVAKSLVATLIAVVVDALARDPEANLRALAPEMAALYRPLFP